VLRQQGRAPHAPLAPPPPFPVDAPAGYHPVNPPARDATTATPPMSPDKGAGGGEGGAAGRAAGEGSTSQAPETSRHDTSRQDAADALIYAASC